MLIKVNHLVALLLFTRANPISLPILKPFLPIYAETLSITFRFPYHILKTLSFVFLSLCYAYLRWMNPD